MIERVLPWNVAIAVHVGLAVVLACCTYLIPTHPPHAVVLTVARATAEPLDGDHDGPDHENEEPTEVRDCAVVREPAPHECRTETHVRRCETCRQVLSRWEDCVVVGCGAVTIWGHGCTSAYIMPSNRCAECGLGLRGTCRGYRSTRAERPSGTSPRSAVTGAR